IAAAADGGWSGFLVSEQFGSARGHVELLGERNRICGSERGEVSVEPPVKFRAQERVHAQLALSDKAHGAERFAPGKGILSQAWHRLWPGEPAEAEQKWSARQDG